MTQHWASQHGLLHKETELAPNSTKGYGKHFCNQSHLSMSGLFLEFVGSQSAEKAPQTRRGTLSGPPLQVPYVAPPRPEPAQRAPGAGGALVSHRVAPAVPSALAGLTSGFGMGPGVPRPPEPPAPGGRCGAGCLRAGRRYKAPWGPHSARGIGLLENGRERRGRFACPEGLGRLVAPG